VPSYRFPGAGNRERAKLLFVVSRMASFAAHQATSELTALLAAMWTLLKRPDSIPSAHKALATTRTDVWRFRCGLFGGQ
jgi:hypothetical protein